MGTFADKVAIVTGAGSGIGKALAFELAGRGARVVVSDVSPERSEAVGKAVQANWGKGTWLKLDVSDYDAVKQMIDDTVAAHGRIDYIFNNAGIAIEGEARFFEIDDYRKVLDVNLNGVIHGVACAYPQMVKQGFGHIINTASIEGLVPTPLTSSYVASKFAVVGLSEALRAEGADLGVKVSVVCPGYTKTAIVADAKRVNLEHGNPFARAPRWIFVTADKCAKDILSGVERNRGIIVVTLFARLLWYIYRLSPALMIFIMRTALNMARKDGRIKE